MPFARAFGTQSSAASSGVSKIAMSRPSKDASVVSTTSSSSPPKEIRRPAVRAVVGERAKHARRDAGLVGDVLDGELAFGHVVRDSRDDRVLHAFVSFFY